MVPPGTTHSSRFLVPSWPLICLTGVGAPAGQVQTSPTTETQESSTFWFSGA